MMRGIFKIAVIILILKVCGVNLSISLGSCSLSCNENENNANSLLGVNNGRGVVGLRGKAGVKGSKGNVGEKGEPGVCTCNDNRELVNEINNLKAMQRDMFLKGCRGVRTSGITVIYPSQPMVDGIHVYCEQDVDGGGWIVIQRRVSGDVDFYRDWDEYVKGFGNKEDSFWLGLENIHLLTKSASYELRVDLEHTSGEKGFAKYSSFRIEGAGENYRLHISGFTGTAGDSMAAHHRMGFTTKDKDNDTNKNNCAVIYKGGWWYKSCHSSNLNGLYGGSHARDISWRAFMNEYGNIKTAEMKIRRVDS